MVEWSTTSAPDSIGRCSAGVAKVLSTRVRAPCSRAIAIAPARSTTLSSGFDGVSMTTSRVFGTERRAQPRKVAHVHLGDRQAPAGQELPSRDPQAEVPVVGEDDVGAGGKRLQQRDARRHSRRKGQRGLAALQRRERGLEHGLGRVRLADVGEAPDRRARLVPREGGREVDGRRHVAGLAIGSGAGVDRRAFRTSCRPPCVDVGSCISIQIDGLRGGAKPNRAYRPWASRVPSRKRRSPCSSRWERTHSISHFDRPRPRCAGTTNTSAR